MSAGGKISGVVPGPGTGPGSVAGGSVAGGVVLGGVVGVVGVVPAGPVTGVIFPHGQLAVGPHTVKQFGQVWVGADPLLLELGSVAVPGGWPGGGPVDGDASTVGCGQGDGVPVDGGPLPQASGDTFGGTGASSARSPA